MIKSEHFWENRKYFVSGFRNKNTRFISPKKRHPILAHFESFCWRKNVWIDEKSSFLVILWDRICRMHCHPIYLWESLLHRTNTPTFSLKIVCFPIFLNFLHDFCVFKNMKICVSFYRKPNEFREIRWLSQGIMTKLQPIHFRW